ncbi:MAG: alpha-N-arabinofuranosidase [Bacteroidales bacterium]|nr:alpha-N-arabinofuranosidase [Bacteroidales bacterium]
MKKVRILFFLMLLPVVGLAQENEIVLKTKEAKDTINKNIYGHFAEHLGRCIYDGIWVGEDSPIPNTKGYRTDILEALKEIDIPVLRWPGGCFADAYHWKDGIGPKEDRPPMLNIFWGEVVEDNSFGTHEFLDLCEMLDCDPYLAVNVGSGSPQEAMQWVEYVLADDNSPMAELRRQNGREEPWDVKFWGIGNENWGCGGNMTASYYADLYKRFATYCRVDQRIASGGLNHDLEWTETLMKKTEVYQQLIQGMSYHHYTVCHNWEHKGSATDFSEEDWFLTIRQNVEMEDNLRQHMAIMDKYDPEKKIGLLADEWGNWHDAEPGTEPGFLFQQNTMRDAITASIYLNVFNRHCDRVTMANIAQVVNVLQAMVLTEGDKMVLTPTFYVFKMYKVHQDALNIPLELNSTEYTLGDKSIPAISASASEKEGVINLTLSNLDPNEGKSVTVNLDTEGKIKILSADIITANKMNSYNDFDNPDEITLKEFKGYQVKSGQLILDMPSKSVVHIAIENK